MKLYLPTVLLVASVLVGPSLALAQADGGDDAGDDAGSAEPDAGPEPVDSGPAPVDSGPAPVDSGPAPVDSGPPPPVDSGPEPVDSGPPPPVDSGPEPVDSGPPPPVDSGPPPPVDSGPAPPVDAGLERDGGVFRYDGGPLPECTPGCLDETRELLCSETNQRVPHECGEGFRCETDGCVAIPAIDDGGCSCDENGSDPLLATLALVLGLVFRRRRARDDGGMPGGAEAVRKGARG